MIIKYEKEEFTSQLVVFYRTNVLMSQCTNEPMARLMEQWYTIGKHGTQLCPGVSVAQLAMVYIGLR